MLCKGNRVSVIDDNINGVVLSVNGDKVVIETPDGFRLTFTSAELIKTDDIISFEDDVNEHNIADVKKYKDIHVSKHLPKTKKVKEKYAAVEFDLHIEQLVPNKKGMSNHEILTLQAETAKRHIEFAIKKRIPRIVLIHGVGEGVLKSELKFLLEKYEEILRFQDGNYQKYGQGATEIIFRQTSS